MEPNILVPQKKIITPKTKQLIKNLYLFNAHMHLKLWKHKGKVVWYKI